MIHLVVLAAGRGRRLGALSDATPKWLLEAGGVTLAERQLNGVRHAAQHSPGLIGSISVVVGHAAPAIEEFVGGLELDIGLVTNPHYEEINNWYSLLLALRALGDLADEERVAVFNADLLARSEWFSRFLREAGETSSDTLIAVDTERALTEESMKVSGHPLVDRIGKVEVVEPVGEYVGMLMARAAARDRLVAILERYVGDEAAVDNWYEHAIGASAAQGTPWLVWPTPDSEWIEIDDEADYATALGMGDLR